MVGELGDTEECDKKYGLLLKKWFESDDCLFVFSTDFCHWGSNYGYRPFKDKGTEIYKHIEKMDREGISLIFEKKSVEFVDYLKKSQNNICGQNVMRVLNQLTQFSSGQFEELKYKMAQKVESPEDWSVTYYSAAFY